MVARTGAQAQHYNLMKNHHTKIDLDEVDTFIYRFNIEHRNLFENRKFFAPFTNNYLLLFSFFFSLYFFATCDGSWLMAYVVCRMFHIMQ